MCIKFLKLFNLNEIEIIKLYIIILYIFSCINLYFSHKIIVSSIQFIILIYLLYCHKIDKLCTVIFVYIVFIDKH
jgi:hypothetical protein